MTVMAKHESEPRDWTAGQWLLAAVLVLAGAGITGITFYVMWDTVTGAVRDSMHRQAWTVPVAGEIAFVFFYLAGVLIAWRKAPPVVARGLFMFLIVTGSVQLNIYAARGNLPDLVGHLLVVGAFFGVLVVGKMVITSLKGGKVRYDRISGGEWVTHPARSASLWWWMKAWGETSRDAALVRYRGLLYARAVVQADNRVGRVPVLWKHRLPVTLRYELSLGELPVSAGENGWKKALREHVTEQLDLLWEDTSQSTGESTGESISRGSGEVREVPRESRRESSAGGSNWPEAKDINRAVLLRRVRAADERWQRSHGGKLLPALHLRAQLQVRMNRETATELLREARAVNGERTG
jgi:hypothetical protein